MSNDLDLYDGGDIQPYDPGMPVLAPLSPTPDTWGGTLTNREIDEYQHQPQTLTVFGAAMPSGTTPEQIQQVLKEAGSLFAKDMATLKYPSVLVSHALTFIQNNATKSPRQVQRNHGFNLHSESGDPLAEAFGNHLAGISEFSHHQKQQFLTAALQWLDKLNKRLNPQQVGTQPPGMAPNSTEALLNQLSDAAYHRVIAINNKAQAEAMNKLAAKYGEYSSQEVVRLAQAHLDKLSPAERAHFDQFTTVNGVNWVHMMNCAETIDFLYSAAIGANNIPKDGPGIAREIAEIEGLMREPATRRAYLKDPQLQARLRHLYDLQRG